MTHFLSVSLHAFEAAESENLERFPTITIFEDEQNNYFLATPLAEIETAIINLIPELGNSALSNLTLSISILTGNGEDAYLFSIAGPTSNPRSRTTKGS
ncbi:MAG: hypothetical protein ACRC2S_00500 [Waterburya sp.]